MEQLRSVVLAVVAFAAACTPEGTNRSAAGVEASCDGASCPVCTDDGTCTTCVDDSCTECTADGACTDCDEYWEFELKSAEAPPPPPPPAPGPGGASLLPQPEITYWLFIRANGTAVIRDLATNQVIREIPGFLANVNGQWVIRWHLVPPGFTNMHFLAHTARCLGPIAALIFIAEMANAGMQVALGDAAAQIGVRLQECKDRFAKVAAGIACLRGRPAATTCSDAVAACPDAFFGANLATSCGDEPAFAELVDALAAAIAATSTRPGGSGTLAGGAGSIADAIRSGTFATNASKTCTMRARVEDCEFKAGDIFPPPPGFTEAQTCWDNATRGVFQSKYEEALECCTTAQCRATLWAMRDC
jgi:hypothetical protein